MGLFLTQVGTFPNCSLLMHCSTVTIKLPDGKGLWILSGHKISKQSHLDRLEPSSGGRESRRACQPIKPPQQFSTSAKFRDTCKACSMLKHSYSSAGCLLQHCLSLQQIIYLLEVTVKDVLLEGKGGWLIIVSFSTAFCFDESYSCSSKKLVHLPRIIHYYTSAILCSSISSSRI